MKKILLTLLLACCFLGAKAQPAVMPGSIYASINGGGFAYKTAGGMMTIGTLNQSGGQTTFGANTCIQPQAFHVTGGKMVVGQLATVDVTTVNGARMQHEG